MQAPSVDINFFDPSLGDPFAVYEEVRAVGPVVWNHALNAWMVTGFEDCSIILCDRGDRFALVNADPEVTFWFAAPNMIRADGDEHHRLRSGLTTAFGRTEIATWERRVGDVVETLLAPLVAEPDGFELIEDFTMIPTVVVAQMLGVPGERYADFRRWSHTIASNLSYGHEDPLIMAEMRQAAREINDYMRDEIARHRLEEPDDLITLMLHQGILTDEEIVSTAILLLIAGYETTAKVMSNCLIVLADHPDQRELVAEDMTLVPAAIEEVLRYWGLVQALPRYVAQDTVLAGVDLTAGGTIYAVMAAANRDPTRWPHPTEFDVSREIKAHMGFGYGPHLCLGAHLARLETKVALEYLLRYAPEYRLRDVEFGSPFINHGPDQGVVIPA